MTGKYIYGIIPQRSLSRVEPKDAGQVNSEALVREKAKMQASGVTTCEQVYTIPYEDISAIVSDSKIIDYAYMPKDAVARLLLRHQMVIESIIPEYIVIPMKLGTFASEEDEVRDILNKGHMLIKDIFEKIGGKIEIDVVATWGDFNSTLKKIGEEKKIKEFKEKVLANPEGITVEDQMKVGVMAKKALDEKREKYALQIQNALKAVSRDIKKHSLMDDKMVANAAFLIEKAGRGDFDKKIEELNTQFHDELNFRCVGPLPPYSFYTLEAKKMRFEEIDWARKRFGLSDFATEDEIKKAHQRLAFSSHPDKNPDTPGMEKEFDEVTRAYKILLDYTKALKQTGQRDICSFKEEEFKKNAILVEVRE